MEAIAKSSFPGHHVDSGSLAEILIRLSAIPRLHEELKAAIYNPDL